MVAKLSLAEPKRSASFINFDILPTLVIFPEILYNYIIIYVLKHKIIDNKKGPLSGPFVHTL